MAPWLCPAFASARSKYHVQPVEQACTRAHMCTHERACHPSTHALQERVFGWCLSQAAENLVQLIDTLTIDDSGRFLDWRHNNIAW